MTFAIAFVNAMLPIGIIVFIFKTRGRLEEKDIKERYGSL